MAGLLSEAKVKKMLLSNKDFDPVQPYKPVQFEDNISDVKITKEETEKDIQAKLEALEQKGYLEGYAAGHEKGIKDAEAEIAEKLRRLQGIIKELDGYKEKKTKEWLPQIIDLALEISKKIIRKEVELDEMAVLRIAQDAIKKIEGSREDIIIRVSHQDYDAMVTGIAFLKEQQEVKDISVEPSSSISPGGVYIITPTVEIDAGIEEQIKEIQDGISTAIGREV
ncbi:FliH/SctL family protein [Thermodesulfovibrionales bacterium]|nr:FliH/SctL family protein [Thermodesulfovibrionales bacterium]